MATYSFYDHGVVPALTVSDASDTPETLGILWRTTTAGNVTSIWFYVGNVNLGGSQGSALMYTGAGWSDPPGTLMGQQDFTFQGTVGWQEVVLTTPIAVQANTPYIAAVFVNANGHYSYFDHAFDTEVTSGVLTAYHGAGSPSYDLGNGRYMAASSPSYPQNRAANRSSYMVDFTLTTSGGGSGSTVGASAAVDNSTPVTNTSVTATVTPSNGTNYTYQWSVLFGGGTLGSATAAQTSFTPTAPGKTILKCVVTATEGTANAYVTLEVSDPTTTNTGHFSATATDSLSATGSQNATLQAQRGGLPTVQERSLFAHRISIGDAVTNTTPLIETIADVPTTFALRTYLQRNCTLTKVRVLKAPLATGDHTVVIWQLGNTTPLASKKITFSVDNGGWVEFVLDEPVQLTASSSVPYLIGYHAASGNYYKAQWVYGSQITYEYPFDIEINGGGFNQVEGTGYSYGSSPTYPSAWFGHCFFIDPVVEWATDSNVAVYSGGYEYYQQFSAWSGLNHFPIGVWSALPPSIAGFKALGINLLVAPAGNPDQKRDAIVAAGMDAIITAEPGDMATVSVISADPSYNALVRGYLLKDEPDLIGPWTSPADLQSWYAQVRARDSSKMLIFNLGKTPVINQGFAYLPTGASIPQVNQYWQQFAHLTDVVSCDFYMEDPANTAGGKLGLWCNPRMVQRLQDLSENSKPIWHYIATTAPPGTEPSPQTVYNSVWASLIGGARGIVFFDTQFTSNGTFITDFAMNSNSAMATKVQSLCGQIQGLSAALMSAEVNLPVTISSSNQTAGPVGGTWGVPIHYTVRQANGFTYLFSQSIRPGTTTGTFTVPAAANKTITVLDESRTLSADSNGTFSDSFSADYQVHLYRWA